ADQGDGTMRGHGGRFGAQPDGCGWAYANRPVTEYRQQSPWDGVQLPGWHDDYQVCVELVRSRAKQRRLQQVPGIGESLARVGYRPAVREPPQQETREVGLPGRVPGAPHGMHSDT